MFIFMHICVSVSGGWGGGEGESPSATSSFLWLCHSHSAFAFERSRTILTHGLLSHAKYVTSWWDDSWQDSPAIPQFVQCDHAEAEGKWKQSLWPLVDSSIQKLTTTDVQIEIWRNIYVLWNLHLENTEYGVMYAALSCFSLIWCVLFTYH